MEFNENTYQQIEDYLNGTLKGDDLSSFEKMMEDNDALRQEVEMSKVANNILFYNEAVELKETIKKDFAQQRKNRTRNNTLGVIGSTLILGILLFSLLKEEKQERKEPIPTTKEVPTTKQTSQQNSNPIIELEKRTSNINEECNESPDSKIIIETTNEVIDSIELVTETKIMTSDNKEGEQKPPTPVTKPEIKMTTPCDGITISASIKHHNQSADVENGQIILKTTTIKGGNSPYTYSINKGDFGNSFSFKNLTEGNYLITIKDKNGCSSDLPPITINKSLCLSNYTKTFNPEYDTPWLIPHNTISENNYSFKLINARGQVLINKDLDIFIEQSWQGILEDGSKAEPGYYKFIIAYPNETCTGNITLFR